MLDVLREFIPPGAPTASLLLYPGGMDARVWLPGSPRPVPIDEVIVIGRAIRRPLLRGARGAGFSASEIYSRQVLAFGKEGQRLVSSAKTAVVGVGGTGSACTEQLIRLGVKDLRLIDYDRFESSNLTRVYGSVWADAYPRLRWPWRKPLLKAEIVRRHLARISPEAKISLVSAHVAETRAAEGLLDRDLIFICTDDHWGRSVVNQISYQYLIPSINLGVRIDSKNGEIIGASGVSMCCALAYHVCGASSS
jgi:molybdopterin-synthase adenylyltransferase